MKSLSVIIINRNDCQNLEKCLYYISMQNYPKQKIEIIIIDGNSNDKSEQISKSFDNCKFYNVGYENHMEARRYIGVEKAHNEIICFIDTDNFIEDKNYFIKSLKPFENESKIIGSFSKWYFPSKNISFLDNYYALIGGNDPIAYYLNRNDRVEFKNNKLPNSSTTIISDNLNYSVVKFNSNDYPVVGCNGFFFRKSIISENILKNPKLFFHTDYFKFIDDKSTLFNNYAITNNSITHSTGKSLLYSVKKRINYANKYYLNLNRTYKVFNPKNIIDIFKMIKLLILALTFIEPFLRGLYYSVKTRNNAWLIHPFILIVMVFSYSASIILILLSRFFRIFK